MLKKLILECLLARVVAGTLEKLSVFCVVLCNITDLFVIIGPGQGGETVRVEPATGRIQFDTVILR